MPTALPQSRGLRVPRPTERHLLSRFSYGVTPGLVREARTLGGARAWWRRQLQPERIPDPRAAALRDWFPYVWGDPKRLWRRHVDGVYAGWEVSADLARWTVLRRILSRRQLHESMVDFWSNLLHVASPSDAAWLFRTRYDGVIRKHALGRFDEMLQACIVHPAMGVYLDNASSTAGSPNENLGRELLELHTVGPAAGYTESDVLMSARILTGYRVDVWNTWRAWYEPRDHWRGQVNVLGFEDLNDAADGRPVVQRYLQYLARHPATAQRIARRLAVRFVSDDPSTELVTHLAEVFQRSGTDIKATLRALVDHPEFASSTGRKVRTPVEDVVATVRVLGVQPRKPRSDEAFAKAVLWQCYDVGQAPFAWVRPDGFPDTGEAWSGVSRMFNSWDSHLSLSAGWWPSKDVRYRKPSSFLPPLPTTLAGVIDHLSRTLLTRPATPALIQSVAYRIGIPADQRIRQPADLPDWQLVYVLATVLDTPGHMTR